jgi:predicted nucleic acid-binding protein
VTLSYLDTSAAMKLLVEEAESAELEATIATATEVVACYVLETEVRRAVHRYPELAQTDATDLLDRVALHEVPPSLFSEAGLLPGDSLRSLDALHVAAAIRLGVDAVATYDRRMQEAVVAAGLRVVAPGQEATRD